MDSVDRICEYGHDGIAHRFDDRPVAFADSASKIGEMLMHEMVGGGVADPLVKRR